MFGSSHYKPFKIFICNGKLQMSAINNDVISKRNIEEINIFGITDSIIIHKWIPRSRVIKHNLIRLTLLC